MKLRDQPARVLVAARLDRLAYGLAGDVQPVGNGISELRILATAYITNSAARQFWSCFAEEIRARKPKTSKRPSAWPPSGVNDHGRKTDEL